MSLFTNDIDTISEALNNSFAMADPKLYPDGGHFDCTLYPELEAVC